MTSSRRRQRKKRSADLGRFFRWWSRELAALVPPGLRPVNRPSSSVLWFGMEAKALVLWRLAGQELKEIGRVNLAEGDAVSHKIAFHALHSRAGAGPLGICLPSAQVLRREITLPLAAAENLAQVLGFELGRQTPFTADQAYYDQRVLREDLDGNRLHVLLGVASRTVVDESRSRLTEWGITPHAIVARDELESAGQCLNLLPPALRPKPSRARYWLYAAMGGLTMALFVLLLAIPLWKKREVVIALQPVLTKAQQQAETVDELKREQERLLAEYNFPTEHKLATPAKVVLLDEVTRILPDNTWLQQLEVHGAEVSLQGNTKSSANLIGLFEQSALLESANFKSPLVKMRDDEEKFQLAAVIKAVDLARALAAQSDVQESKVSPKVDDTAGKQPGKKS